MNGGLTRIRIRCATLRHAEMPKGSRRAPNVYRRVHSRPVTRHSGSAFCSPAVSRHSLLESAPTLLNLSCNKFSAIASRLIVFPQLFHIGKFFLPTYGLLVSTGVLIGLWISVRNSEQAGDRSGRRMELGHSGGAVRHYRRQDSVHRQRLELLRRPSGRHLQLRHAAGGRRFFRRADWRICCRGLVHPQTPYAGAGDLGCVRARAGLGHAIGRVGCFAAGCCYGKADQSFLGRDVHQSDCASAIPTRRWEYRWSRRSFSKRRSSWRISSF